MYAATDVSVFHLFVRRLLILHAVLVPATEKTMFRTLKTIVTSLLLLVAFLANGNVYGQQSADVDAVNAASKAFYAALNGTDVAAMHKVWAKTPYVAYVGPTSKAVTTGWEEVKKVWETTFAAMPSRTVSITGSHIQARGTLAWEIGNENGVVKMKDGAERKIDIIVTNIYEKIDGQWLMVSHHVQPKPQ